MNSQFRIAIGLLIVLIGAGTTACSGLIVVKPAQRTAPSLAAELTPSPAPSPAAQVSAPAGTELPRASSPQGLPAQSALPSRIVAETINLDAPIVAMDWRAEQRWGDTVSVWNVPANEAGWHANSASPGQDSNVVISGHNNSSGGHVFGRLEQLVVGDRITIQTGQELFVYQVSQKQIVRAFGASQETLAYLQAVTEPTGQEQLTLITCWPSWTNTHRLIIVAHP